MDSRQFDATKVVATIARLSDRIEERFPSAGLSRTCRDLLAVARDARHRAEQISEPNLWIRCGVWTLLGIVAAGLLVTVTSLEVPRERMGLVEFVLVLESGINDVVLIAAAVVFLVTVESRLRRRRGLRAIHELRSIAHVIDMHQLTKDPERILSSVPNTPHSPKRTMGPAELGRYLDYCSEMLSLTGKVGAIYVANFDDPVLLAAVNEVEHLTTGLSRKIWQKLTLLHRALPAQPERLAAPRPRPALAPGTRAAGRRR